MAIFQSNEQLYQVLQGVFAAVSATPAQIEPFTKSNLVIRMQTTDPAAEVLLDGRQPPLEVFFGPRPGKANLEVAMPADLLHLIWTGQQSASEAFFSGRIKTKGNLLKATQLLDLFRACEAVYPTVAAQHGIVAS
ncbi:MAG: SCP2 sterol-binding domain-containing protein [Caldilineaceae bacterium]